MTIERAAIRFFAIWILSALLPQVAAAHGGVVQEEDLCVIKVNYLRAHFKVYQPRVSGHEQFCEDLPAASESVFVMEYQHDALGSMPIDFRIIRDVTGKGRFARMEDIEQIDDLDSVTVFYQAALTEPDVFAVVHEFVEEGDFIGIVSAIKPDTNKVYAAVFPFEVGFTGIGYWPFFIAILLLLQLQYLAASLCLCTLLVTPEDRALAEGDELRVTYESPSGTPAINWIHSWILHVESADGVPVENAKIEVNGGMPEHDHGLPTQPRVTEELGDGDYRLDGVRFHMRGYWEITVTVVTEEGSSVVVIPLQL
jgi:hypothetical protein